MRFGSFAPGDCPAPSPCMPATPLLRHPAPNPLLLHARNANAWLTFLWNKRGTGDARFQGGLGLEAMADGRPSQGDGCVLFPSCSDVPGFADCPLCLSRFLCRNAYQYPEMSQDQLDAVERIRESSHEEGDHAILDHLRRALLPSLPMFPED